jgi:hypothetical protein
VPKVGTMPKRNVAATIKLATTDGSWRGMAMPCFK